MVSALWVSGIAHAQTTSTPSSERTPNTMADFQALKALEKQLVENLKASDQRRQKIEHNIRQVRLDLTNSSQALNRLAIQKDALEAELLPLETKVKERLKARQVSLKRGEAFLRLFLQKGGATRFMTSRGYLNAIAALDLKMMQEYRLRKNRLLAHEDDIQSSTDALRALELKLAKQAVEIDTLNEERFVLLEQAKREKRRAEETARRLGLELEVSSSSELEQSFLSAKGKMRRPVKGTVVRRFGSYRDPKFNTTHRSDGWWIEVSDSAKVHAVHDGRVLYSGPFKGYGMLVIVEHSPRFHTVYAHLNNITVSVNQALKAHQVIGRITKSKRNRRPRLYFEIRKDKKPKNPRRYLSQ